MESKLDSRLEDALDLILSRKGRGVMAIDGDCASGKTTLAGVLAEKYDAAVIHMDDFFLRPEQRTPERYREAGGNIDYERFAGEVLTPLFQGREVVYRRFDCRAMDFGERIWVPPRALTVVEGAYSLHPKMGAPYDLKVFLHIGAGEQRDRIIQRNGTRALAMFEKRWIPYEKNYFDAFHIPESCDLILSQDSLV